MKIFFATVHTATLALLCLLTAAACGACARAQSESDIKTMEKARAVYLTGPVPGSISCAATVDWDAFFAKMKIDDATAKSRLALLKDLKVSVASQDAEHTQVKVDAATAPPNALADGLRMQLQGFFQMYWSEAYGRLIAKRGDKFELTATPGGYSVKMAAGSAKVSVDMDKAYLITSFGLESAAMNATVTPQFKPGDDGLLRLRNIDETINMGSSKMIVNVALDYQKVGEYDIPQHVTMSMPGSYSFDYTLTGCEVNAAKPAVTVFPPPPPSNP